MDCNLLEVSLLFLEDLAHGCSLWMVSILICRGPELRRWMNQKLGSSESDKLAVELLIGDALCENHA